MEITGDVDFGTLVADSKIIRKEIAILNRGSKNGAFKLIYEGGEPITIIPKQGVVKSGYSQPIRVCVSILYLNFIALSYLSLMLLIV